MQSPRQTQPQREWKRDHGEDEREREREVRPKWKWKYEGVLRSLHAPTSTTPHTPPPSLHRLPLFLLFRTLYPCRLWLRKIYEISRVQQRVCVDVCLRARVCKQSNFKTDSACWGLQKWEDELGVGGRWEPRMCPCAGFPPRQPLCGRKGAGGLITH